LKAIASFFLLHLSVGAFPLFRSGLSCVSNKRYHQTS
jgi:hypothetical protein